MAKYLVEVSHGSSKTDCMNAVALFLKSGSHFMTNADWGCLHDEHKAWFFMDVNSKDEALRVVPPAYRKDTKITKLNKFSLKQVEELMKHHVE
jgi:hypothetical protein